jgi:parvulin-like peptidyl-prolyl isomerase
MAKQPPVNEVHARHILVKTKEEAEAIIKELDKGGDFEKIEAEIAYLSIAIEKTAGPDEREAWGWLMEKVEGYFAGG